MKIGIITDSIRDKPTGVGFYAEYVTKEILGIDEKNKYFYIDYLENQFNSKKLYLIKNPFKFFKTYLWHNFLPFVTRKLDYEYILNFSAVPHYRSYIQKEIFFVYDISWYLYPEYHPKSRVLFYKYFFGKCLKNAYKIVVDSISTKQDLIKIFNVPAKKIHIIYPPFIDKVKDITKTAYNINYPYILFIGTIEPRKNIISIIKAFKNLKDKQNIEEKLIICGKKGWLYTEVFKTIKDLKLEKDIIYLGYITNEEKKWLYKNAKFFVYPSWYEGFGIPVLEAMTYGCPVITSNVSSLPEVAGDSGITIDPKDIAELTNVMGKLIKDKQLLEKMKSEGLKQVQKLSNTNQIEELLMSL